MNYNKIMHYIVSPSELVLINYVGNYEKILLNQFENQNFTTLKFTNKYNNSLDYYVAITKFCKKNDIVLFVKDDVSQINENLFYSHDDLDVYRMVMSIGNFYERVRCHNFLSENCKMIKTSNIFGGNWVFWNFFTSFYLYLLNSDFIEQRQYVDELVLNLILTTCEGLS